MTKIFVPINLRPRCQHPGCTRPGQHMGIYKKDGTPNFRKNCNSHHSQELAANNGFASTTDYLNSKHPYRKHRKTSCENKSGFLGFRCNYKIIHSSQLEVDHINGNPHDNSPNNLQTLCSNCHKYKTWLNKDTRTPGRKSPRMLFAAYREYEIWQ